MARVSRRSAIKIALAGVAILFLAACSDMEVRIPGVIRPIFQDEFILGQTGMWALESDEMGSTTIVPEQLVVDVKNPNLVQYAVLKEPAFADFSLEVDGRIMSGVLQSSYGVLFRMQSPEQFYRFEITGDGLYVLERHDLGGVRAMFGGDWRDSTAIGRGVDTVNRLGVKAQGPTISVYVNDVLLEEVTDTTYPSGNIALDAGTFNAAPVQVAFDNLVVFPPDG